jgi:hypothetical protein
MKARYNLFAIAVLLTGVRVASAQCYTFSSGSAASFTVDITNLPSPTMPLQAFINILLALGPPA